MMIQVEVKSKRRLLHEPAEHPAGPDRRRRRPASLPPASRRRLPPTAAQAAAGGGCGPAWRSRALVHWSYTS